MFPLKFKIAGEKHNNRIKNYKYAHWQSRFVLEREPDNKFDGNAIKVKLLVKHGTDKLNLGYVPAKYAVDLAPMLDAGQKFDIRFQAKIVDDAGITHGMIIKIDEQEVKNNDRGTKNIFDTIA